MKSKCVVFDLDDTLAYEIDYLKSAYTFIAKNLEPEQWQSLLEQMLAWYNAKEDTFLLLQNKYPQHTKESLLDQYRNHYPAITLNDGANELLTVIKEKGYKLGLITDGRSVTQRNKLKALGIETLLNKIIISEEFGSSKPDEKNFIAFGQDEHTQYYYIADNPKKDFVAPNKLGWITIALKNSGKNIHPQNFDIEEAYRPQHIVNSLRDIAAIIG